LPSAFPFKAVLRLDFSLIRDENPSFSVITPFSLPIASSAFRGRLNGGNNRGFGVSTPLSIDFFFCACSSFVQRNREAPQDLSCTGLSMLPLQRRFSLLSTRTLDLFLVLREIFFFPLLRLLPQGLEFSDKEVGLSLRAGVRAPSTSPLRTFSRVETLGLTSFLHRNLLHESSSRSFFCYL